MSDSSNGKTGRTHADGRERGSALVMALLLAAVLVLLGTTFVTIAVTDRTIASNETNGAQAFHLAEAGIDHAIADLVDQDLDTLLGGGGALFTNEPLAGGTYTVVVSNNAGAGFPSGLVPADPGGATNDTDGYAVVTASGSFRNAARRIRVTVLKTSAPTWPYAWAAFGLNELKASNSEIYGPAGTNGNMSFSGDKPKVYGDAQAVGTISDGYVAAGFTETEGAPPETFPPVSCPAIPYGPAPTCPSPPCGGISFDPGNGKLSINGPAIFPSGTYLFSEFSKSGGDDIVVPLGANVQIHIEKKMSMSGGGFTNLNGTAESLQIWGCDPSQTSDFSITGPQTVWFTVYAPTHKIKFTGAGDKYGSFIGAKWENSGPGDCYYDNSLSGGGASGVGIVPGTWTDLW